VTTQEQAPQLLDVNSIEHSPRVKVRLGMHAATVARYAEAFESGAIMDPIDVFREKGTDRFVLADGSHRLAAAHRTQRKTIATVVHEGDETDALKFALRCNAKHGLLRRDSDVQVCIRSLMLNASLTNKYKTHQERAELLGMSYGSYQRHFAKYRTSSGGSDEEKDEKTRLQQKAAKKARPQTPKRKPQPEAKPPKSKPAAAAAPALRTAPSDEGAGGATAAAASKKPTGKVPKGVVTHADRLELQRAFATLAFCELDPEEVAVACGIPAKNIERALDFVRNVREHV
jgi:uncharacterized ParB-like nuclease family protein